MKKFLALALAVLMALSCLAGCAPKEQAGGGTEDGASLTDAVTFLNSLYKDGAKETPVDFDVVAKIKVGKTEFSVTWATDNEAITVKASDKAGFFTVDVPDKTDAEIPYKLKATVSDGKKSQTVEFNRVVPIVDNSNLVDKPEENVAYKLHLVHATLGQTLYAIGETQDDKYIKTTLNAKEAPDFYVEEVEGGFKIFTTINGKKAYVTADVREVEEGKFSKFIFYSDKGSVWTYKSNLRAWFTTVNGGEYVMGTYSSYKTISISEASYITEENSGKTQFPAVLIKKEAAESSNANSNIKIYQTGKDIVNAAYKLEAGKYLSAGYEYTLTGVITKINTPYSTQYGNVTVTIVVNGMTDKPIELFRLKGNGADKLEVGNTVTAKGPIVNYAFKDDEGNVTGTKVEMEYPTVVSHNGTGEGAGDTTVDVKFEAVTAPVAGTAYKMFIAQNNIGKLVYLKGATQDNQGKFILSSTKASEGVDVYVEKSGSGYKFYATIGGAKKYLKASTTVGDDNKVSKFLNWDTTGSVFTYKKAENAWFTTVSGAEYVIGTYNTYDTASLSDASYMTAASTGKTQFPVQLVTKAAAEQAPEVKPDEPEVTPTTGGTVWTYDSSVKAWSVTLSGEKYYFGSYSTFTTLSLAGYGTFLTPSTTGVTQFPASIVNKTTGAAVTAPAANTAYRIYFDQKTAGKQVYALGTATDSQNKYISTTETASQAVDVYAEAATGGYKFYILDGTTKKYLNGKLEGTSKYIAWEAVGASTPDTPDTPVVPDTGAVVPVAGTAYKFGMVHAGVSTTNVYYINGQMASTYYFGTTTDKTAGLDVYLETTTGGYYLYTTIGGAKKYINMVVSGTHVNGKYEDAASTVYTIDTANKTVAADVSGVSYIFGTSASKTFTTVGPVKAADDNYFLQFYTTDATGGEGGEGEGDEPEQTLTPAEIVNAAYALEVGASMDGTQTLTGIITSVDTAYNPEYYNITVTILVENLGDKKIQCFRLKKGETTTNDDVQALAVGDTITVSGTLKNYNGTIEFDSGCTLDSVKTAASIIEELYALTAGQSLTGKYALTGVISNIASAWSDQHSNISVDMIVNGDTAHPVQAFRIKGKDAAGAVIDDVKNLAVGDTITIYGTLKRYNNTYEFDSGCELVALDKAPVVEAGDTVKTLSIADYATANSWTNGVKYTSIAIDENITATATGGQNSGKFYTDGGQWRLYESESCTLTIAAAEGKTIKSVKVTYVAQNNGTLTLNTENIASGTSVDVNAESITFGVSRLSGTSNGQARVTEIEVVYAGGTAGEGGEGGEGGSGSEGGNEGSGSESTTPTTLTLSIADYATANNWSNSIAYNTINADANITITANRTTGNSNTGKYYTNGNNWRIYQNEAPELTVTAAAGKTITSVKFTYVAKNTGTLTLNGTAVASDAVTPVNANTITFSVGNTGTATNGNIQITAIEVIYQ